MEKLDLDMHIPSYWTLQKHGIHGSTVALTFLAPAPLNLPESPLTISLHLRASRPAYI